MWVEPSDCIFIIYCSPTKVAMEGSNHHTNHSTTKTSADLPMRDPHITYKRNAELTQSSLCVFLSLLPIAIPRLADKTSSNLLLFPTTRLCLPHPSPPFWAEISTYPHTYFSLVATCTCDPRWGAWCRCSGRPGTAPPPYPKHHRNQLN
jgi:hypothetical protein